MERPTTAPQKRQTQQNACLRQIDSLNMATAGTGDVIRCLIVIIKALRRSVYRKHLLHYTAAVYR